MRRIVLTALLAMAAMPANALAGTVEISEESARVQFTAAPGETNRVTATDESDALAEDRTYLVEDRGAILTAGIGCTSLGPHRAECSNPYVFGIAADLGDGDDRLSLDVSYYMIEGGPGADRIDVRPAADLLRDQGPNPFGGDDHGNEISAGDGDDVVLAGTTYDNIYGGEGNDRISDEGLLGWVDGDGGNDVLRGSAIFMYGSGGNDRLTSTRVNDEGGQLSGGDGDDRLVGGPSRDWFRGGAGDDTIDAFDLHVLGERVDCEDGVDTARVDPFDAPVTGCENVETLGGV